MGPVEVVHEKQLSRVKCVCFKRGVRQITRSWICTFGNCEQEGKLTHFPGILAEQANTWRKNFRGRILSQEDLQVSLYLLCRNV